VTEPNLILRQQKIKKIVGQQARERERDKGVCEHGWPLRSIPTVACGQPPGSHLGWSNTKFRNYNRLYWE
jgi:hypothetical protein